MNIGFQIYSDDLRRHRRTWGFVICDGVCALSLSRLAIAIDGGLDVAPDEPITMQVNPYSPANVRSVALAVEARYFAKFGCPS